MRYHRQMILENFGAATQEKLLNSAVLVVGAGGLGCPVLLQLATMGVRRIGIVDDDLVSLNNLHRQHLFTEDSVGSYKCDVAKKSLLSHNSEITIETYPVRLSAKEAVALFPIYDIIVDGTDNFETRYLINDACVLLEKPLVYGAVFQYEGQVAGFNILTDGQRSGNYRDLFPSIPNTLEVPTCNESGAFGVLTSTVGNYMAQIVFSLISGLGNNLSNQLLTIDLLHFKTEVFTYAKTAIQQEVPLDIQSLLTFPYEVFCEMPEERKTQLWKEILESENTLLVDVRAGDEMPAIHSRKYESISLAELNSKLNILEPYENIIFVCQSGIRSREAMNQTKTIFPNKNIYSLPFGVNELNQI
jgi:molybdopterin/thiamine biosynthesis adenylyltransferase/rhodanese-related sulfurtransferase